MVPRKLCPFFFAKATSKTKKWKKRKLLNFGEKVPAIDYAIAPEQYPIFSCRYFLRARQVGAVI